MGAAKAIFYLGGFSALGYFLMKVATPNESDLRKEIRTVNEPMSETMKKRHEVMNVLKAAAEGQEPWYSQKKKPETEAPKQSK